MQHIFKLAAVAALCAASLAHAQTSPYTLNTQVEFDARLSNQVADTATNVREGGSTVAGQVQFDWGTRFNNSGYFVNVGLQLPLKKDEFHSVHDAWVQAGNALGDLKLGRFEGMDLFPLGPDNVVEYVTGYRTYQANTLRGRHGSGVTHAALGVNAAPGLRLELGLVSTQETGLNHGLRGTASYTTGPLTLRGGMESIKTVGTAGSATGMGLSASFTLTESIFFNANFAAKDKDSSIGLNATLGPFGMGWVSVIDDRWIDKANTLYAAYTLPVPGLRGARITPAISWATGGEGNEAQLAAGVRFHYGF